MYRLILFIPFVFYNVANFVKRWIIGKLLVRNMLGFRSGKITIIAASMKWPEGCENPTGYENVTGAGQFYGLPNLSYILKQAFNPNDITVKLSEEVIKGSENYHDLLNENVIILGGTETNRPGAYLLNRFYEISPVKFYKREMEFIDSEGIHFEVQINPQTKELIRDYGLVIRTQNPLNPTRSLLILIGIRTFGTAAAAYFITHPEEMVKVLPLFKGKRNFAFIVQTDIKNCIPENIHSVKHYILPEVPVTGEKPVQQLVPELRFLQISFGAAIVMSIACITLLLLSFLDEDFLPLSNLSYLLLFIWASGMVIISRLKARFLMSKEAE